jgi:periplasmic divalent cation tolerance protein
MEYRAVFVTAPNGDEALKIARALVEERLAACVNIISGVRSIYRWEGNVEDDTEVLMVAKTTERLFGPLSKRVKELHSYAVPEVIGLSIVDGLGDYLGWIDESTGQ